MERHLKDDRGMNIRTVADRVVSASTYASKLEGFNICDSVCLAKPGYLTFVRESDGGFLAGSRFRAHTAIQNNVKGQGMNTS